jgi:hypothetical protein
MNVSALQSLFNTCPQSGTVRMVDLTNAIGGLVQGAVQGIAMRFCLSLDIVYVNDFPSSSSSSSSSSSC